MNDDLITQLTAGYLAERERLMIPVQEMQADFQRRYVEMQEELHRFRADSSKWIAHQQERVSIDLDKLLVVIAEDHGEDVANEVMGRVLSALKIVREGVIRTMPDDGTGQEG